MKHKVLVETTVLISSSVYSFLEDMKEPLKHEYFERSVKLLSYLAANVGKRIGIVTARIERESYSVIEKAVRMRLEDTDLRVDYPTLSFILDACTDRLRRNIEGLVREPIIQKRVDEFFAKVAAMYSTLNQRADLLDKETLQSVARDKAEVASSKRYRGIATEIYTKQEYDTYSQLRKLVNNKASTNDMMFLAEAMYLREVFSQEGDLTMHIASTDTHLSPFTVEGKVVSSIVTDQIAKDFNVYCDWPERVLGKIT